jgi:hypothetical protein
MDSHGEFDAGFPSTRELSLPQWAINKKEAGGFYV